MIRIAHNMREPITWLILFLVGNFRLIVLGLLILSFRKPLDAITIFALLFVLIFTVTKPMAPNIPKAAWRLIVLLMEMEIPEEE